MSGFFENTLTDAVKGFTENPYLRDFQHASKTFRTNAYQYSPKFKFLFHVYFDINRDLISSASAIPADGNIGLTVKTVQLPKYTFELATMNQYNRKRIVQSKIKYDPINITFHDDNGNLIRKLWYTYYTYYFKDSLQLDQTAINGTKASTNTAGVDLNRRNIYDPNNQGTNDWGYIGDTFVPQTATASGLGVSKAPFFRAINIFGFNQHNFVMYRLINPMIESLSHDTYDYSQSNGVMEHQMSLQYETVKYYDGAIDGRTPDNIVKGFGKNENYDTVRSPISRPGANGTILGQGGLADAVGGVADDLANGNIVGALQKAAVAKNTFKNPQNIVNIAKGEVISGITNSLANTPNRNNSFNFPSAADAVQNAKSSINNAYKTAVGKKV